MREELVRTARNEAYDEQPLAQLSSEAFDFRADSELLAPFRAIKKRDLQSPRLVVTHQGRLHR